MTIVMVSNKIGVVALDTTNAWQWLMKQGLVKGAKICKLDFHEHCVLRKQTRVKFVRIVHQNKGTLDYVHTNVWELAKVALLEVGNILLPLLMTTPVKFGFTL